MCFFCLADAQERKIYNAYVTLCLGNSPGSSNAEYLVLRLMSEVLEQQHGLKLFIHVRDDAQSEGRLCLLYVDNIHSNDFFTHIADFVSWVNSGLFPVKVMVWFNNESIKRK